eukprot:SAG22_NODE_1868_length_3404_cov_67.845688_7_plen_152_part_00
MLSASSLARVALCAAALAATAAAADTQPGAKGISFQRTINDEQKVVGSLTFDKGCSKSDKYGSNNCLLAWGAEYSLQYNLTLQSDLGQGSKISLDMKVRPAGIGFFCPRCLMILCHESTAPPVLTEDVLLPSCVQVDGLIPFKADCPLCGQ